MFFYPINLIVAQPLNKNKSQLLATFENWRWEIAEQLLKFFAVFELDLVQEIEQPLKKLVGNILKF